MKKFSFFLGLALFAMTQVANAAQPTSPLVAKPCTTAPAFIATGTWDGTPDAVWAGFTAQPINVIFKGEESGFGPDVNGQPDCDGTFKVTFDNSKIYFLFIVADDVVTQDPAAHWNGDKIEIYFGLPGYDQAPNVAPFRPNGLHGRQFAIKAQNLPTIVGENGSGNYPGGTALATNGVNYSYAETANGYALQVSIDRAIALEAVPNQSTIAFDVCIADNDEAQGAPGKRYRKSWFNDGVINELWMNMAGAGQLKLDGAVAGINEVSQNVPYAIANNVLTLGTADNVNVNVFDVAGKPILTANNTKQLNIANLKTGVYITSVKTVQGAVVGNFRFVKH